jgi:hypothetical protein
MASPTIPALAPLRPVALFTLPRAADVPQPAPGELLRLRIVAGPQGALLGSDDRGLLLQLPAGAATPGELLVLRVLAREPSLTLQILQRDSAPQARALDADTGWACDAMRPDQAWLQRRQVGRPAESPRGLAGLWLAQALALQLQQPEPTAGPQPGSALQIDVPMAPIELRGSAGEALWLRLLNPMPALWHRASIDEEAATDDGADVDADADADRAGLCLCVQLCLDGAWLLALLQWRYGLLLHFSADSPQTLHALRSYLPRIAAALSAVPVRLRHCSMGLREPALTDAGPSERAQGLARAGSPLLFRAAAEIVAVLQQA